MDSIWDITDKCNLGCMHCYMEERNRGALSDEQELGIVNGLADIGVEKVFIGGGEPFMKPGLEGVMAQLADRGIRTGLVTNGTRVDYGLVERAEPESVQVSIDGGREFHDWLRMSRCHDAAMDAVRALSGYSVSVGVSTTLMKGNVGDLAGLVEDIYGYADGYRANLLVPVGRAGGMRQRMLEPEEVIEAAGKLYELGRGHPGIRFEYPREYPARRALLSGEIGRRVYAQNAGHCECGGSVAIQPNGNVLPCVFLQDRVIGNAAEAPLSEIMAAYRPEAGSCSCAHSATCRPCPALSRGGRDAYCIKV